MSGWWLLVGGSTSIFFYPFIQAALAYLYNTKSISFLTFNRLVKATLWGLWLAAIQVFVGSVWIVFSSIQQNV